MGFSLAPTQFVLAFRLLFENMYVQAMTQPHSQGLAMLDGLVQALIMSHQRHLTEGGWHEMMVFAPIFHLQFGTIWHEKPFYKLAHNALSTCYGW